MNLHAREVLYCGTLEDGRVTGLTDVRAVRDRGRLRLTGSEAFEAAARADVIGADRDDWLADGATPSATPSDPCDLER